MFILEALIIKQYKPGLRSQKQFNTVLLLNSSLWPTEENTITRIIFAG